jgi:cystathionine beta-lyase
MSAAFDFEHLPDLTTGDSVKWNRYAGRDVLPLWVADMDFAAPPAVVEALQRRVARASFGYAQPWPALVDTVCTHLHHAYDWSIEAEWLVWLPGLVSGLNVACRTVDGGVLTATPIYPPFLSAPRLAGRALTTVPLRRESGCWCWDLPALDRALAAYSRGGLLLLCHPHNPVGRAWQEDELQQLAVRAAQHGWIVCSDEIHCGLMLEDGRRHRPFASLSADAAQRSITLMAPSKTFNIAGLGCAFAVIPDAALRRRFCRVMQGIVPHVNALGLAACEAALRDGGAWHAAVLEVLRVRRDFVEARVARLPGLSMSHVEAGYLAWIDAGELCATHGIKGPPQAWFEAAGVGLSAGLDFTLQADAAVGQDFVRLNFACPQDLLAQAFKRIERAMMKS